MKKIILLSFIMIISNLVEGAVTTECDCVEKIDDTHYKAWFGYTNNGTVKLVKAIGTDNKITGGGLSGLDQGQLRVFAVGTFPKVFPVKFDGTNLTWTMNGISTTASSASQLCSSTDGQSGLSTNYNRVTVYNDDGGQPQIATEYSDGLGKKLETHIALRGIGGYDDLVTGYAYDEVGRQIKTYKPFPANTDGGFLGSVIDTKAKQYFSGVNGLGEDAQGYPYTETSYCNDPLIRKKAEGFTGKVYSLDPAVGNPVRYWFFGTSDNSGKADRDADGFLTCEALNKLVTTTPEMPSNIIEPEYSLNVIRDADGKCSQQIIETVTGKTIAVWSNEKNPPELASIVISKNKYNILGNLTEQIPPGQNLISSTSYSYNQLGQLSTKISPDGAIEVYEYDDAGNLLKLGFKREFYQDYYSKEISYEYDNLNRITTVSSGSIPVPKMIYAYDCVENIPLEYMQGLEIKLGSLHNLKGHLVAIITFGESGDYKKISTRNRVVELFSYDAEGRIEQKFTSVPGIYLQQTSFEYDLQGKTKSETVTSGNVSIVKKYEYDELGRISKVLHDNGASLDVLATYKYDLSGRLQYRQLSTTGSYTEQYSYTIRNWMKEIASPIVNKFNENISYNNSFVGNITGAQFSYQTLIPQSFNYEYTYDGLNRLGKEFLVDGPNKILVGDYSYDMVGRFLSKKEISRSVSSDKSGYEYYNVPVPNSYPPIYTSRLKKIGSGSDRFTYDNEGNLIIDKEKKMIIQYDYRNLPVFFRFYSSIPSEITADLRGTIVQFIGSYSDLYAYMDDKIKNSTEVKLLSVIAMLYDSNGNRVLKTAGY